MANRRFDESYVIGVRIIDIMGSFATLAGAGTVIASSVKGFGFGYAPINGVMTLQPTARNGITSTPGILRTGTGVYTVTFDDSYADVIDIGSDLQVATGGSALWAQPNPTTGLATSGTAPTCTFTIINSSGTPTEGGTTSRLNFRCTFRDSTTQFTKP